MPGGGGGLRDYVTVSNRGKASRVRRARGTLARLDVSWVERARSGAGRRVVGERESGAGRRGAVGVHVGRGESGWVPEARAVGGGC